MSVKEELDKKLKSKYQHQKSSDIQTPKSYPQPSSAIKHEIAAYENTGIRGQLLSLGYKSIKSIPVTSTESERAFSVAGIMLTDLRCSPKGDTLSNLCLLRAHFSQQ
uniref:HAT C-terminal dimerisation domain-containing protein n=1 Tax=Lygus hesperus TaxID=30085 RepID=A0A0K8TJF4_LYGHE